MVGLKENVIVGRPIPAGTGSVMNRYREIAQKRDSEMEALEKQKEAELAAELGLEVPTEEMRLEELNELNVNFSYAAAEFSLSRRNAL